MNGEGVVVSVDSGVLRTPYGVNVGGLAVRFKDYEEKWPSVPFSSFLHESNSG